MHDETTRTAKRKGLSATRHDDIGGKRRELKAEGKGRKNQKVPQPYEEKQGGEEKEECDIGIQQQKKHRGKPSKTQKKARNTLKL